MITLEDFAKKHKEWIKICMYFGADYGSACEIVQQMYLKIGEMYTRNGNLDRMTNYEGNINTVYVFKVLNSLYIDFCKPKTFAVVEVAWAEFNNVENIEIDQGVLFEKIKGVVSKMGEYDRMLIELYFVHGKSIREISKQTGIGVHSIFNSIKNAKEKIKKECRREYESFRNARNDSQTISWSWRHSSEDNEEDRD